MFLIVDFWPNISLYREVAALGAHYRRIVIKRELPRAELSPQSICVLQGRQTEEMQSFAKKPFTIAKAGLAAPPAKGPHHQNQVQFLDFSGDSLDPNDDSLYYSIYNNHPPYLRRLSLGNQHPAPHVTYGHTSGSAPPPREVDGARGDAVLTVELCGDWKTS